MNLRAVLPFAHDTLRKVVRPGDYVVDATCGNGHDTLLLAELVGVNGHVLGFDIQQVAIAATKTRLENAAVSSQVELICASHATIPEYATTPVRAAIFNLGYLPGGDKKITTTADSTILSIQHLMELLEVGGVIILVIYHGHPEGKQEKQAVVRFCETISQQEFHVLSYQFINQQNDAPFVIVIEKRKPRQS
ncbi:class I SAM-dependent methyltransferase [Listeria seeligeri]|uniref:class I SAM-dependent methyltransferase n=1 Tax=Listeria seeligeri TaxID=1640 RepID=UPI0016262D0E|nr:class I SAM-dependent methyltransferase [Listeria seeligeri]MBC1594322.1 methyltransferase domain-containing protein [Listeria seeligeri]MBC2069441.1 methyltransferase domain-containing protein [Listeria seeligeri]MBC2088341.1 methyltransferase domain-containing protein [Listeria seeligeri]MBC2246748.1 methyltransferase domain-containing protein [Listeria seeligeri]MBF2395527.1 class I SAM-dependent methyltransferase [Listeria seeligeri]